MKSRIGKFLFLLAIATVALTGINAKKTNYLLITETEPALDIEHWMTDEFFWNKEFTDVAPAKDKELNIETWMYNDDHWK
jgi:hypothetical protein